MGKWRWRVEIRVGCAPGGLGQGMGLPQGQPPYRGRKPRRPRRNIDPNQGIRGLPRLCQMRGNLLGQEADGVYLAIVGDLAAEVDLINDLG